MHIHMDDSVGFFPSQVWWFLVFRRLRQEESLCIDTQMQPGDKEDSVSEKRGWIHK